MLRLIGLGVILVLVMNQNRYEPFKISEFIEADDIRPGSRVGGRVKQILIEEGQQVSRGELLTLSLLFLICGLGLGMLVSTIAQTQLQAVQFAFLIMLPSVLLSGFMFPRSQMPLPIYLFTFIIPVTYFLEILRGIVLRGAGITDLLPYFTGLSLCCVVILAVSLKRFQKQLT